MTISFQLPSEALIDERISIRLDGLSPGERISIQSTAEDEKGRTWRASITAEADESGRIDLTEQAPIEGTYSGIYPMGLIWSMRPDADAAAVTYQRQSHEIQFKATSDDKTLSATSATIHRYCKGPNVDIRTPPNGIVGTYYSPAGAERKPGVLVLHGSEGAEPKRVAAQLASRGIPALSLQYFGDDDSLPDQLSSISLGYFERASEWLMEQPGVVGDQFGVLAYSRGGELALLHGSHSERVGGVVAIAGSGVLWEGFDENLMPSGAAPCTINGTASGYISLRSDAGEPFDSFGEAYEHASVSDIEQASIAVEDINGSVLFISGKNDGLWDAQAFSDIAMRRLTEADFTQDYRHLIYENAGHNILPPYLPTYGLSEQPSVRFGGTPRGNAVAARDHWPRVIEFFSEI